jgi:hypothetical protein
MGNGGLSNFSKFARRQKQWTGRRAIERPPEQPERSAADEAWLRANIRKEQQHDEQQGPTK